MPRDPRLRGDTAPVFNQDTDMAYARRTTGSLFISAVIVVVLLGLAAWWFLAPKSGNTDPAIAQTNITSPDNVVYVSDENASSRAGIATSPVVSEEDQGGILDSIGDTIEEALPGDETGAINTSEAIEMDRYVSRFENLQNSKHHSLQKVIGSEVDDIQGVKAGKIHDVIVHKETGIAKAIIVDQDGGYYDRDMAALEFEEIITQNSDGDVEMLHTKDTLGDKVPFDYGALNTNEYVSLQHLENGQLLDDQGKVAGEIYSVIYENAEAQEIFFALKPSLSPNAQPKVFGIPYKDVNIVRRPDGYDVQLTATQTQSLAEALYALTPQQ